MSEILSFKFKEFLEIAVHWIDPKGIGAEKA